MAANAEQAIPFEIIEAKLGTDDDREFWQYALSLLAVEFMQRHAEKAREKDWVFIMGPCSHWVRPHNSLWNQAGGFAFPEGYKDSSPELDWSVIFLFRNRTWIPVQKLPGKRLNAFRIAIPSRTARHNQAAVNTRWTPGNVTVLYGFRKTRGNWNCVAVSDEKTKGRIAFRS